MNIMKKVIATIVMSVAICPITSYGNQPSLSKNSEPITNPQLNEEIITIATHDNLNLEGKLRLSVNGTANKLIIYVNGSGPNTYDNKRFLGTDKIFNYHDLFAEQITAHGGAYFSYNTRGVTLGDQPPYYNAIDEEIYQTYTPSNEIQDIETIIKTLTADPRLKGTKVYLLGWSAGTIIAPQVALRNNVQVDALLLAGYCNQTMEATLDWQQTGGSSMVNMGWWFDYDQNNIISKKEYQEDKFGLAAQLGTFESLDVNKDAKLTREDYRIMLAPTRQMLFDAIESNNDKWLKENYGVLLTTAWFKDYRKMPPNSEILPQLDLPIYIFQGEKDANTPVQDSYDAERTQRKVGKDNIKLAVFGEHDHDLNYMEYVINGTIPAGLQAIFNTILNLE